jgi:hypothetical protein
MVQPAVFGELGASRHELQRGGDPTTQFCCSFQVGSIPHLQLMMGITH